MARPRSTIHGVGINDAPYITQPSTRPDGTAGRWICPYYQSWKHMLERVYSEKEHERNPATIGNSACGEWSYFMNFRGWMDNQVWEGLQLDKDILIQGNQHYSPETCAFIPGYINALLGYRQEWREALPFGVSKRPEGRVYSHNWTNPYSARCCIGDIKAYKHLGYFADPMEAHAAWQVKKISQIECTISRYRKRTVIGKILRILCN